MPQRATPLVSVVVPCRNEARHIEGCIRSILKQDLDTADLEVLVVDGLSEDGTRDILSRLANTDERIRVLDNPDRIVSTGMNTGIRNARGAIIVRIDAHTEYASDYVLRCVEFLDKTKADNVGGPARTRGNKYIQRAICAAYHSFFSVGGARFHDTCYEGYLDTVPYGCWRREAFDKFGLFDEELIRNQDDEHNLRIIRAGGKIYQSPQIKSWYSPRNSLLYLFRQYMQYGYWKVRVMQKHGEISAVRHVVPAGFLTMVGIFAVAGVLWPIALLGIFLVVGIYIIFLAIGSIVTALRTEPLLFPVLPAVFICYHLGYGYGFMRGVVDFLLLKRPGRGSFSSLSRPTTQGRSERMSPGGAAEP